MARTYKKIVIQADKESDVIFKQHPYDGLHLLRRIYFDLFRVYYLAGVLDPNTILTFLSDKNHLKALLNQNLDEFEAYYIKFAIAQFLAHDLLFTLSFTAGTVDEKIYSDIFFQHINLPHDVLDNQEIVAKKAIELFEYAIKLMNQLADKTALFIEYHMYGVKLSLENENFGTCEEFYKKYIKFAEDEKDVEYQSYAELYKLKMILVKMNSLSVIEDLTAIARLAKEAKKQIDKTKELQKKCNMVNGNPYADLRLELYDALLDLRMQSQFNLSRKSIKQKFLIIKNKAEAMKYRREVLLIQYLEKTNFLISTVNWKNIVRYYPIVTQ